MGGGKRKGRKSDSQGGRVWGKLEDYFTMSMTFCNYRKRTLRTKSKRRNSEQFKALSGALNLFTVTEA